MTTRDTGQDTGKDTEPMNLKRLLVKTALNTALLFIIIKQLKRMSKELDDLKAAVAADTAVDQSAITLLGGLKAALDSAISSGNKQDLIDLSNQLGINQAALAAAVVANTPAAEPPVDEPPVDVPPVDEPPVDEPPVDGEPAGFGRR